MGGSFAQGAIYYRGHVTAFRDRFDSATYADDEPVEVTAYADPSRDTALSQHIVPERLMTRIQLLAKAYDLHLLAVTDANCVEPIELNAQQAESLAEELSFVGKLVNDDLVQQHLIALHNLALRVSRYGRDAVIVFDGP